MEKTIEGQQPRDDGGGGGEGVGEGVGDGLATPPAKNDYFFPSAAHAGAGRPADSAAAGTGKREEGYEDRCMFWNETARDGEGRWSDRGLGKLDPDPRYAIPPIRCTTTHLTDFSVTYRSYWYWHDVDYHKFEPEVLHPGDERLGSPDMETLFTSPPADYVTLATWSGVAQRIKFEYLF